jgi:hypothetical protein
MRLHSNEYIPEIAKRVYAIQLARRDERVKGSETFASLVVADEEIVFSRAASALETVIGSRRLTKSRARSSRPDRAVTMVTFSPSITVAYGPGAAPVLGK